MVSHAASTAAAAAASLSVDNFSDGIFVLLNSVCARVVCERTRLWAMIPLASSVATVVERLYEALLTSLIYMETENVRHALVKGESFILANRGMSSSLRCNTTM